jgi:membrane protein implicated in regulation of membrane protease activity
VLVVALLVAGLVCLCAGLLLSSTAWLIASLACSVVAGLLIYRNRAEFVIARPGRPQRALRTESASSRSVGKHAIEAEDEPAASDVASARPDPDVWVVDGRPRYHRERCQIIEEQDAEAIPLSQAAEDGFIPCSLCLPERVDAHT